jgi:SAM-dependent methyltransferase
VSINVNYLNEKYPKYPMTAQDKGWVYGVWYCAQRYQKTQMYGEHPATYLKRLLALFPDQARWLHAPGGCVNDGYYADGWHVTLDLVRRRSGSPSIVSDVAQLPFEDASFDIVETDPPYGAEHEVVYGTPTYPRMAAFREFHRILKPGGYVAWLDVRYPSFHRKHWKMVGAICVVTGFERVTRLLSIFQKIGGPINREPTNRARQIRMFE